MPLTYGVSTGSVISGWVGSALATLGLFATKVVDAYRARGRQLIVQRAFTQAAEKARSEAENAYMEASEDLAASRSIVEDLLSEVGCLNNSVMRGKTKDALIEALQRRVQNISAEYNDKKFGQRATTLADVRKLTGEG